MKNKEILKNRIKKFFFIKNKTKISTDNQEKKPMNEDEIHYTEYLFYYEQALRWK